MYRPVGVLCRLQRLSSLAVVMNGLFSAVVDLECATKSTDGSSFIIEEDDEASFPEFYGRHLPPQRGV